MFFVSGITGQIGGAVARGLLDQEYEVRALVRDLPGAKAWSDQGVELREGDLTNAAVLAECFQGVEGAFLMQPTPPGVGPGFPEAMALNAGITKALRHSPPPRAVVLSSVGSEQRSGLGNITQTHMLEKDLATAAFPIAFVRAGALLENYLASMARTAQSGVFDSFLQPVDRAFPMVATKDVGAEVVRLLTGGSWEGRRVVEMGSPVTPNAVAAGLGQALGQDIEARALPREQWDRALNAMGLSPEMAANFAEMQDGFNSGWIDFGRPGTEPVGGITTPAEVFAAAQQKLARN